MKKQFLSISLLFAVGLLYAQDIPAGEVPSVVINQFHIDFPKAKDIEWELKNDTYEVEFEQGWGKDFEAWYTADGKQIKVEEETTKSELPKAVVAAIQKSYPSYKIDDIEKITEGEKVTYKVEVEKRELDQTLLLDEEGTIIHKK